MRIVLWGTYDTGKPRIRILRSGLREMSDIDLEEIHVSVWGGVEDKSQISGLTAKIKIVLRWMLSYPRLAWRLARTPKPDLLLISYPGMVDVLVAFLIARARKIPIAWDVFLSIYDTVCEDRGLIPPGSLIGRLLKTLERTALHAADIVFMDTKAHASRVERLFGLEPGSCGSVWVGVESEHFRDMASTTARPVDELPMRVLFYGQFIPLHGVGIIIEAARLLEKAPVQWRIIGVGQTADTIRAMLREHPLPCVKWIEWADYTELRRYISDADLCLGIFGTSEKAASVIPNKVFQILACGRPLITRDSPAIREIVSHGPPDTYLVPAGDPVALANAVMSHLDNEHRASRQRARPRTDEIDKTAVGRQFLSLVKKGINA